VMCRPDVIPGAGARVYQSGASHSRVCYREQYVVVRQR